MLQATQNRMSIGSRAKPTSLVVTCRATACRVMSYRIMCRIVSYRAMLYHVVLFHACHVVSCRRAVSPCRVVSCCVLSRPVVSMWWFPNGVCAQAFLCQRIMSVTQATDSDQITNGTPATYLLILEVFKKKKIDPFSFPSARSRQTQRAPRTTPRSTIHAGGCLGPPPRDSRPVSSGPGVTCQKKIAHGKVRLCGQSPSAGCKKNQEAPKAVVPARSVRIPRRTLTCWCWWHELTASSDATTSTRDSRHRHLSLEHQRDVGGRLRDDVRDGDGVARLREALRPRQYKVRLGVTPASLDSTPTL